MINEQLERTLGLLGEDYIDVLKNKTILIAGLGGVGGTALEALARTGFCNFVIVDCDVVNLSNLNRQTLYTLKDIGKNKVDAAEERLLMLNDTISVKKVCKRIDCENIKQFNGQKIDFVVDAIDDIKGKIALAKYAFENSIPLITSLGMANRFEPNQVEVNRLDKTTNDPLAKKFRHDLKAEGIDTTKIMAVCSKEIPVKDGIRLNSTMMVPSSAGLNIANYVIRFFKNRRTSS